MAEAFIALGSNLGNREDEIIRAIREVNALPRTRVTGISRFYSNPPMGPQDQPDYLNGAVRIETELDPLSLLDALQGIEKSHGRVKTRRWGERCIDLDIALYGEESISSERLTVPHLGIEARDFVLRPLMDIDPSLTLPTGEKISELLSKLDQSSLTEAPFPQFSLE
jgi:2-amino-4-hydroxy-6-hydroxymethyldihydropteridine diphosphokinase